MTVLQAPQHQMRQCGCCGFRFPTLAADPRGDRCPRCGAETFMPVNPHVSHEVLKRGDPAAGPEVVGLLDNIRSVFNVGSMFRTADGAGIRCMHLCGITPTPENPKLGKTALGAELEVPWEKSADGVAAAIRLKQQGLRLWALEGGPQRRSLFATDPKERRGPLALVVGNEVSGVDPDILRHCDGVFYIPMQGSKGSLNVAVAFGVAAYFLRFALRTQD
jgi:23S rRNA (guanosine2251-2'-O)-methyltransferase